MKRNKKGEIIIEGINEDEPCSNSLGHMGDNQGYCHNCGIIMDSWWWSIEGCASEEAIKEARQTEKKYRKRRNDE